jgi:hypothetical protein
MGPYVCPGTGILRNLRGILDPDALNEFEAEATSRRIRQLEQVRWMPLILKQLALHNGYRLDVACVARSNDRCIPREFSAQQYRVGTGAQAGY